MKVLTKISSFVAACTCTAGVLSGCVPVKVDIAALNAKENWVSYDKKN